MHFFSNHCILLAVTLSVFSLTGWGKPTHIIESERKIPLCREVDVVVIGGSSGAVAAAQKAAQSGASVFLAAPRTYLGDDIAGTLRLWLNKDEKPESPLARNIYTKTNPACLFSYESSIKSGGRHIDKGNMLNDGQHFNVQQETVEFADSVTFTLKLDSVKKITGINLIAFQSKNDYKTDSANVSFSSDGKQWSKPLTMTTSPTPTDKNRISFTSSQQHSAKFIKMEVLKKEKAKRMLLAEIIVRQKMPKEGWLVTPTPLHVKQALDNALLDAGVSYLTGTFLKDILHDSLCYQAGIVMANRSGRQAIAAKIIIDASERATAARIAGAQFSPYPSGPQTFKRIIIAGAPPDSKKMSIRQLPGDYDSAITIGKRKMNGKRIAGKAFECTMQINMKDGSYKSFAEAEQIARDRTFVTSLLEGADSLFHLPPDKIKSNASLKGKWPENGSIDTGCFQPQNIARMYVLGGCANISREAAEKLLRPVTLMSIGEKIGAAAAAEAKKIKEPAKVICAAKKSTEKNQAEIREYLAGVRPFQRPDKVVESPRRALPILGRYDVVVVGGGTCGAPAGIAASRTGARTLVIEQLYGMGGISTLGMIGQYCYGNRCGFTTEHDKAVKKLGAEVHIKGKRECWRRENRLNGAELWFGAIGCGAVTEGNRVIGVVVATPDGRGVVLAENVVDATGNSDIAAVAGAECIFVGDDEIALQGVGLSPRELGASYINSDFGYVSDSDVADLWLFGVHGRHRLANSWDASQLVQSRERKRIIGEVFYTTLDLVNKRTFPDTVVQARSNYDSHGYTIADICFLCGPDTPQVFKPNIPYRAMLPRKIDNIIVTGLGISAHRDSMPIIRMQPDIQNMGYVAGRAAAIAAQQQKSVKDIDVKELQRHLVEIKIIPKEVLNWKDSRPVSKERLTQAVVNVGNKCKDVSIVLEHFTEARPLLQEAYKSAKTGEARLCYAKVLGMEGDATGIKSLIYAVNKDLGAVREKRHWSEFLGRRLSDHQIYIIALGRTGDKRALKPLIAKAKEINESAPLSSFRAITIALENLHDPSAAAALARLLQLPKIRGNALTSIEDAKIWRSMVERHKALRELSVARALYRCGDYKGLAEKTLKEYALDLRGVYALHATELLKKGKK
jgi:hypothetical protein